MASAMYFLVLHLIINPRLPYIQYLYQFSNSLRKRYRNFHQGVVISIITFVASTLLSSSISMLTLFLNGSSAKCCCCGSTEYRGNQLRNRWKQYCHCIELHRKLGQIFIYMNLYDHFVRFLCRQNLHDVPLNLTKSGNGQNLGKMI